MSSILIVDAANVVGSVPDGWWKDRAGAAAKLRRRVEAWARGGVAAAALGMGCDRWYPPVSFVVEGAAKSLSDDIGVVDAAGGSGWIDRVTTVRAPGHGDDAIVVDSSDLTQADVVAHLLDLVQQKVGVRQ